MIYEIKLKNGEVIYTDRPWAHSGDITRTISPSQIKTLPNGELSGPAHSSAIHHSSLKGPQSQHHRIQRVEMNPMEVVVDRKVKMDPMEIVANQSTLWRYTCWVGCAIKIAGDAVAGGKVTNVGYLLNLGDIYAWRAGHIEFKDIRSVAYEQLDGLPRYTCPDVLPGTWLGEQIKWAWSKLPGRISGGLGGSVSLEIVVAYGFTRAASLQDFETEGLDFEFSIGVGLSGLVKSFTSGVKSAKWFIEIGKWAKTVVSLGKATMQDELLTVAKDATTSFVRNPNHTGVFIKRSKRGIQSIPVPFAGWGVHVAFSRDFQRVNIIQVRDS